MFDPISTWALAQARPPFIKLVSLALLAACTLCRANEAGPPTPPADSPRLALSDKLRPRAFFVQIGGAAEVTEETAGLTWSPAWKPLRAASWSAYMEASLSRWQSRGGYESDHGVLTQVALVPVLRWRPGQGRSAWFGEGGIGATLTSSVYHHGSRRFSTSFNFGDHVGMGYSFGAARDNELALRFEHFSNAGIKHPNPGQNFIQLRYVHSFR